MSELELYQEMARLGEPFCLAAGHRSWRLIPRKADAKT
jgi:hypothetical protein